MYLYLAFKSFIIYTKDFNYVEKKFFLSLTFIIMCGSSAFALQGLEHLVEDGKEAVGGLMDKCTAKKCGADDIKTETVEKCFADEQTIRKNPHCAAAFSAKYCNGESNEYKEACAAIATAS